ncbi:MAG: hypothetical protein H0W61_07795 [Bacteroidetes bacterium]|nr:hypothetical protein [Bacteroidota bacterium]
MLPIPLILGIAAYFFKQSADNKIKDAKSITLIPVDVQASDLNNIKLKVQAVNPSGSEFKINSLVANLYYKNTIIGSIQRPEPFTIKKTDNSIISFKVKPNAGEAIATVLTLLFNKKEKYKNIKVLGAYNYKGLTFPIDKTIQLNA